MLWLNPLSNESVQLLPTTCQEESRAHSTNFLSLHLRHRSFSKPSVALPTSQIILQPFRCFTYVTAHSLTLLPFLHHSRAQSPSLPSLHLRHRSFSNLSVGLPTSQLILQPFFRFSYVTAELILQALYRFTYVTAHFPTLPSLYLRHKSFSNPCVALPTSQLILQPFFRFSYVTVSLLTSRGEPPVATELWRCVFRFKNWGKLDKYEH